MNDNKRITDLLQPLRYSKASRGLLLAFIGDYNHAIYC